MPFYLPYAPSSFRVRHRTHGLASRSSSQVTLLEFAGARWSLRHRFGLQCALRAPSSSWQHPAPCTPHHAPRTTHQWHHTRTMHHLTVSCTTHGVPCVTHPLAYDVLDGPYAASTLPHTSTMHHPGSHGYTVLMCTMLYPYGMIAHWHVCTQGCIFY